MRAKMGLLVSGLFLIGSTMMISCSGSDGGGMVEESVVNNTIECSSGTIEINDVVEIDAGESGPAILASGDCIVTINSPGAVSLLNCVGCIRALGDAAIEINAVNEIVMNSTIDGVRAQDNATVMLQADNKISITSSGEDGIDVDNNGMVTLNSAQCEIRSSDLPIDISGSGTVDTSGCAAEDFQ